MDLRSDLFSFGIVLYEMLTGVNPFKRDSGFDTAEAILKEIPAPISKYRNEAPPSLVALINKLLAKDPKDRYQQAREVADNLQKAIDETFGQQIVITQSAFAKAGKALKKPVYLIPLILVLAAAAYFSVQGVKTYQKGKWAREVAPKEVERLMEQSRPIAAARLLKEAMRYAPESKELDRLKTRISWPECSRYRQCRPVLTFMSGITRILKTMIHRTGRLLGRSPLAAQLPSGYHRFRIVKEGFEPVELGAAWNLFYPNPASSSGRNAFGNGMGVRYTQRRGKPRYSSCGGRRVLDRQV